MKKVMVETIKKQDASVLLEEKYIKDYQEIYDLIDCNLLDLDIVCVEYKGYRLNIYVDDEGMLKPNYGRYISGYPNPIFGNIVIMGDTDEEGGTLGLPDELSARDFLEFSKKIEFITGVN
jgi:hypothetical protein